MIPSVISNDDDDVEPAENNRDVTWRVSAEENDRVTVISLSASRILEDRNAEQHEPGDDVGRSTTILCH